MTPRLIIYPINYFKSFFPTISQRYEQLFLTCIGEVNGNNTTNITLGRARSGIYLFCKYYVSDKRNKVLLSPYTIPDVVNMVRFAGGEPIFVDHVKKSTNLDLDHLKTMLADDVACLMITHYHVNQAEIDIIIEMCRSRGVGVFEDCAISMGGEHTSRPVGTISDGGVYSLSTFKFLNYYWGGIAFTRNKAIGEHLKKCTEHWKKLKQIQYSKQIINALKYDLSTRKLLFYTIVFPYIRFKSQIINDLTSRQAPRIESTRMDETLLSKPNDSAPREWYRKFPNLKTNLFHRRQIARIYNKYLEKRMVSTETSHEVKTNSCFINYPIYVKQKHRNFIYKELISNGFDVGISLYHNCHTHETYKNARGKSENVTDLINCSITLPTHPRVTHDYARRLAKKLHNILPD